MKKWIGILSVAVAVLLVATVIVLIVTGPSRTQPPFTPPPFDGNAKTGVPDVPDNLGWHEVYKAGMSFRASLCGEVWISPDGTARIYFTNHEDNTLWLKVRILDSKGNVLGESGLIRPGEYLPKVTFEKLPQDGEKITLKIMSYQPETYYSGGAASVNTVARLKGV